MKKQRPQTKIFDDFLVDLQTAETSFKTQNTKSSRKSIANLDLLMKSLQTESGDYPSTLPKATPVHRKLSTRSKLEHRMSRLELLVDRTNSPVKQDLKSTFQHNQTVHFQIRASGNQIVGTCIQTCSTFGDLIQKLNNPNIEDESTPNGVLNTFTRLKTVDGTVLSNDEPVMLLFDPCIGNLDIPLIGYQQTDDDEILHSFRKIYMCGRVQADR